MSRKIKMFGQSGRSVEEVFGDFVLAQTANNTALPVFRHCVLFFDFLVTVKHKKNRILPNSLEFSGRV